MHTWRFLPLLILGAACSVGSPGTTTTTTTERTGRAESAIINGVLDKTHPAAVALILGSGNSYEGACTGTIVRVDVARKIGWVATAAHCVARGVSLVVQAENYASDDAVAYNVIDYAADPSYKAESTLRDFALVRIGGVDASTPSIPLATAPDGLVEKMQVTSVGFGKTGDVTVMNTQRYAIEKPLDEITPALLGYEQATSGVCFGDSGGPVIAGAGATARVVGIHSFVAGGCDVRGYSARVTNGLAFFDAELAKALPEPSCALCEKIATSGAGKCALLIRSCLGDDECRGYYECIGSGEKTQAECFGENPRAEGPFRAASSCVCGEACADTCTGAPSCAEVGACGHKFTTVADACVACIESSCCEEARDCTADGGCYLCLKREDSFSSCKRNEPRKKLATCASERCTTECAGSTLQTIGAEAPKEEPDAGAGAPAEPASSCACTIPAGTAPAPWRWMAGPAIAAILLVRRRRRRAPR